MEEGKHDIIDENFNMSPEMRTDANLDPAIPS
jgi:hypothetical protein